MLDTIAETPISEVETRELVRVRTQTPLLSVVKAMREGNRGAAIVEDGAGNLLGIFTERHLVSWVDHSSDSWHDLSVDEVMFKNPKTIAESHFIREALKVMSEDKIRVLPIMNTENQVTGMVSIRDILAHIAAHFPADFLNLPPDPEHEATDLFGG